VHRSAKQAAGTAGAGAARRQPCRQPCSVVVGGNASPARTVSATAGARDHRFWPLSALRIHTQKHHTTSIYCGKREGRRTAVGGPGQYASRWSNGPHVCPAGGRDVTWPRPCRGAGIRSAAAPDVGRRREEGRVRERETARERDSEKAGETEGETRRDGHTLPADSSWYSRGGPLPAPASASAAASPTAQRRLAPHHCTSLPL
jgi:hypothetical protein